MNRDISYPSAHFHAGGSRKILIIYMKCFSSKKRANQVVKINSNALGQLQESASFPAHPRTSKTVAQFWRTVHLKFTVSGRFSCNFMLSHLLMLSCSFCRGVSGMTNDFRRKASNFKWTVLYDYATVFDVLRGVGKLGFNCILFWRLEFFFHSYKSSWFKQCPHANNLVLSVFSCLRSRRMGHTKVLNGGTTFK